MRSLLASLIVSPLRALDPPLLSMLGGIVGLGIVYALLTLLLGCWSETDIDYFPQPAPEAAARSAGRARLLPALGRAARGQGTQRERSLRQRRYRTMSALYEPLFRRVLFPLYETHLRKRKTLAYLGEYERSQWLAPEAVAALRWQKLKALLEHCYREVPYLPS